MEKIKLRFLGLGLLFWASMVFLGLKWGAVDQADAELIAVIRLPRVILASAIGMGLSVAGAALQALFSNPLCEPYTLGISAGAALGAVIGMSLGVQWMVSGVVGTAFIGALIFAFILYCISYRQARGSFLLLLTGVMLGFLGNALVALWIALTESNGLQAAVVWLFGDLSRARLNGALFAGVGVILLVFLIWVRAQNLDALLLGEEEAAALGVDTFRLRRKMILVISLLLGLCVSAGGMIGFVGLIVPHWVRRFNGSLHRSLIPLSAIWGAGVLTAADWVSRVVARPYELPVGVVTALIGAPVFLWVMLRSQRLT